MRAQTYRKAKARVLFYDDMGSFGQQGSGGESLFTGAGYPQIGQTLGVQARFTLSENSTEVYGAFGSKSESGMFEQTLDRNGSLSLIFIAHDADERYKIDFLTVQVEGTIVRVPGDATNNGQVNLSDLSILGEYWGQSGPSICWDHGDFNRDNAVNLSDLSILGSNWGYDGPEKLDHDFESNPW